MSEPAGTGPGAAVTAPVPPVAGGPGRVPVPADPANPAGPAAAPQGAAASPQPPLPAGAPLTGPPAPPAPPEDAPDGPDVTLYPVAPVISVTLPPLDDEDPVVITAEGTQVTAAHAHRARHAAALSGLQLREEPYEEPYEEPQAP